MVSVTDDKGQDDIITVAWTGTICTNPPMVYISVRPSRFSHHMLMETGEFVINLTTEKLTRATDYCGVRSGRDVDKFKETGLTREKAEFVKAPMIKESPVSIECRVTEVKKLGSHDMFLAEVLAVHADEE
jgi:flavin reductase (DIM6/NTAB) family NADH-FMN oxidoreductase RutF